jgi:hypothetical protein
MKDNRSLEQKIREVHEAVLEAAFDRNSKIRMKMANVGRPTDGPSMLAKQGEIKTKVIDEDSVAGVSTKDTPKEQPDSGKKKKDTGNEKALMEPGTIQGGKTEVDLEPTTDDRDDDGKKINTDKKATKAANVKAGVKEETMNTKNFGLPADLIATVAEALKGGQKKLDANHNGKIDGQDFKILRGKKKVEEEAIDEGNPANKAKKDAAVAGVGAKNRDEKHLGSRGMKTSVADKIRGREKMSGKDRMEEEVESIDELSKDTLVSYALKAHRRGDMAARMSKKGDGTGYDKDTAHIANKRYDGVQTAIKKIATKEETDPGFSEAEIARIEEIEQIDELSKDTMKSYVKKVDKKGESDKRSDGLGMASKKIAKQETNRTLQRSVNKIGNTPINKTKTSDAYKYDASREELKGRGIHNFAGRRTKYEETDPGFSEAEIARIEEIASNIDEVVTARKLTPSDKAAKEKYLAAHKAKLASHDTGIEPKKSFKDVNSEPGNYTKQPSKMGIRHSIGSGYYKNDT